MIYSKHNIFSKIAESDNYFIVNLLSGSADILNPEEGQMLNNFLDGNELPSDFKENLIKQGYLINKKEEDLLYRQKYLDFIDTRDEDEVQLFFVPNYSCNFACTYCYQDEYSTVKQELTTEVIDTFFKYINKEFVGRKKYLTIFGGEPLLNSPKQKELISYLLNLANTSKLDVCFVTNGYSLVDYIYILRTANIREIQVTLDGTEQIHNARRFLKDGSGTFAYIVKGIDACLENKLNINLHHIFYIFFFQYS